MLPSSEWPISKSEDNTYRSLEPKFLLKKVPYGLKSLDQISVCPRFDMPNLLPNGIE